MHQVRLPLIIFALLMLGNSTLRSEDLELPQTEEVSAVRVLIHRFASVEQIARDRNGILQRIALRGLPGIEDASFRVVFDPKTGHVVEVSGNRAAFTNDDWSLLVPLKELRIINLHHNFGPSLKEHREAFDGSGLLVLKENTKLETINLPGSPFGAAGLKSIAAMPQVKHLGIWHVDVRDDDFAPLRGHTGLESIRIAPMWSPKITDQTIEHLAHCPNLKSIKLNESYVTWENGLRHLLSLRGTFQELNLENSVVPPDDLKRLRKEMPQVEVKHAGLAQVGGLIRGNFKGAGQKLPKWVPQELLDQYLATAARDNE